MTDRPTLEAQIAERLRGYEFPANVHGDRVSLKLTADAASSIVASLLDETGVARALTTQRLIDAATIGELDAWYGGRPVHIGDDQNAVKTAFAASVIEWLRGRAACVGEGPEQ